ncbi:alpha/beta hydrolase, partial [Microbacterium sp. H6]
MHFTSRRILDDRITERTFTLGDVSGILWTP